MASFAVENFGCRAARADGEAVSSRLSAAGMAEAGFAEADVVILNTCSVTAEADRDARAFLRKTRRLNPAAKVVVTGCYAQRAPEEVAALEGVSAVIGNSHKGLAPEIVLGLVSPSSTALLPASSLLSIPVTSAIWADDLFAHSEIENAPILPGQQTRPNLKIQEGCGNRCTFCIIPTTRGHSRSLAPEKVLAQVRGFVEAGGKELVLSGINLGRWGRDLPQNRSLASLIRQILAETALPRLRLSSVEPMDWTAELIDFFRNPRLARHAHLPLQSGSDAVLRRMHRRYRPWHYEQKVADLVAAVGPALALGADVMVGFPGENEVEFQQTYNLIDRLPFSYLHLFPFSARPGTRGWELHRQAPVPGEAVQERMAALKVLAEQKSNQFRRSLLGQVLPAITLHSCEAAQLRGQTQGLADNFVPVYIDAQLPANELVDVEVAAVDASGTVTGVLRHVSEAEDRTINGVVHVAKAEQSAVADAIPLG